MKKFNSRVIRDALDITFFYFGGFRTPKFCVLEKIASQAATTLVRCSFFLLQLYSWINKREKRSKHFLMWILYVSFSMLQFELFLLEFISTEGMHLKPSFPFEKGSIHPIQVRAKHAEGFFNHWIRVFLWQNAFKPLHQKTKSRGEGEVLRVVGGIFKCNSTVF